MTDVNMRAHVKTLLFLSDKGAPFQIDYFRLTVVTAATTLMKINVVAVNNLGAVGGHTACGCIEACP